MSDQLQRFGDELPATLDNLRAWYAGLALPAWLRTAIDHVLDCRIGRLRLRVRTSARCCRSRAASRRRS